MKVKCYVAVPGIPMYSSEVTLTVTSDTTPPTVVSAKADSTFLDVVVKFSEPVSDSALLAAHYTLDQGATVSSVDRVDDITVKLNTSRMTDAKLYTLTINGVQDSATPANTIAANTQIQFKSWVFVPGIVLRQKYTGFLDDTAGNDINTLFNDSRFPSNPNRTDLVQRFEYPPDGAGLNDSEVPETTDATYKLFYDTLEGWFTPPVDGNYVFFIAFADRGWLYLSTDESPANKIQLMHVEGWSDPRDWLGSHDYNPSLARSDTSTTSAWPGGSTITLQAGKRYYMMMAHFMTSGAGGQWFAATYKLAGNPDPAVGSVPTLAGSAMGSYLDPTVGSVAFTLQPTNVTVSSGNKASFYAAASGSSSYTTNLFYQWQSAPKGNAAWTDIAGATTATYTTDYLGGANDGTQFRVIALVPPQSATSLVATVTVSVDTTPPTVVSASTDTTWTEVLVKFSEPVGASALTASNYQMDKGITVSGVTRVDTLSVKLSVSQMTESQVYTLTINGVQDIATPPNTIAANTQVQVRSLVVVTGSALHKKYANIINGAGTAPENLFSDPRYPSAPDRQDMESRWEYPANGIYRDQTTEPDGAAYRQYTDTIEGYFIPETTTNYVFYICGADRFWLYLSTDDSPANMHLIAAQYGGWTDPRGWVIGHDTDMTVQRSDTYTGTQWPNLDPNTQLAIINLQAGKRYYMLEIHHDCAWSGADDFAATFKFEGEPDPFQDVNSPWLNDAPRLTGSLIGYYFDPSGATVNFTQQPQNATAVQGQVAKFSVVATGSSVYGNTVFFQWQSAPSGSSTWTDIAGATAATYTTPMLALGDSGTQFRVIASVPPYSLASSVATLAVQPDTTAPVVTVGAMQSDVAGVVDVGVGFDETVDAAVGVLANYSVSPGTITSITVYTNRFTANSQNPFAKILKQSVLLTVTGLSGSGTVTVRNVGDVYGNKITSVAVPFTADTKMKWGVVGANELGGWNAVTPVAPNGWDMYSDGVGAWAQYR